MIFDAGQWTWKASKGHGYSDLQATIVCQTAQVEPSIAVNQTINLQW